MANELWFSLLFPQVNHTHAYACYPCPAGRYCASLFTPSEICPMGYYCPAGTSLDWRACPRGTYSDVEGLYDESQCKPCPPGQYCDGEHLDAPSGEEMVHGALCPFLGLLIWYPIFLFKSLLTHLKIICTRSIFNWFVETRLWWEGARVVISANDMLPLIHLDNKSVLLQNKGLNQFWQRCKWAECSLIIGVG